MADTLKVIDLADELRAICTKVGLEYTDVIGLAIELPYLTATVLRRNENGNFYLDDEQNAVADHIRFRIAT